MQALLREYTILGVTTNREFLLDIMTSAAFAAGETDTAFLDRYFTRWQPVAEVPDEILALAALGEVVQRRGHFPAASVATASAAPEASLTTTPWQRYDGWRIGGRT
jgi:acetyl/propionyl-CoA carboxylase alpha subunit